MSRIYFALIASFLSGQALSDVSGPAVVEEGGTYSEEQYYYCVFPNGEVRVDTRKSALVLDCHRGGGRKFDNKAEVKDYLTSLRLSGSPPRSESNMAEEGLNSKLAEYIAGINSQVTTYIEELNFFNFSDCSDVAYPNLYRQYVLNQKTLRQMTDHEANCVTRYFMTQPPLNSSTECAYLWQKGVSLAQSIGWGVQGLGRCVNRYQFTQDCGSDFRQLESNYRAYEDLQEKIVNECDL